MYNSIGYYDLQALLSLFESVAWAAVVGVVLAILILYKPKLLTKQYKQIVWVLFAAWAIASIGLSAVNTYSYFSTQRSGIVQSIESFENSQ